MEKHLKQLLKEYKHLLRISDKIQNWFVETNRKYMQLEEQNYYLKTKVVCLEDELKEMGVEKVEVVSPKSLEEIFELPDTGESVTSVEALQSNIDIAKDQYKLDLNQVIKVWKGLSPSARKTNKKRWIKNYPNIQWDEVLQ